MMKKLKQTGSILMASFLLFACGSENEPAVKEVENTEKTEVVQEKCLYTYNADSTSLNWTAFKTTDRVGVNGSFKKVKVNVADSVYSLNELIESVGFDVDVNTIFTNNPERDETLRKFFFASLEDDGEIYGEIKIVEGDNQSGGGTVKIKINGVSRDVGFEYELNGNNLLLRTKINLDSFNGQEAIETLNSECGDLHKGADGVSKMWSDITIEVKALVNKEC